VREIVRELEVLQKALERYSKAGGQTKGETWRQLTNAGELRSADPVPRDLDSHGKGFRALNREQGDS
jgi:hypothetical protein